jgi:glycosyltransferase involved in cell wall biosynthesis
MGPSSTLPRVSIVLPTYNRARFLPSAIDSIRSQRWSDWELIIVDDGSTDGTREVVEGLRAEMVQPLVYVRQQNAGAYAARNRGLNLARSQYVAFFDSDDLWLPHHLDKCVRALEENPRLDWVYGACTRVDGATGRVLVPNRFYEDGRPRPFLKLKTQVVGDLRIIDDADTLAMQLRHGLFCGLQVSVFRQRVFDGRRFVEQYLVVEDELFTIRSIAQGTTLGYFDEPHAVYRVHPHNSSATVPGADRARVISVFSELVTGLEGVRREIRLSAKERRALARRLGAEYFWHLGYQGFWLGGQRREALGSFARGLRTWPWDWRRWKTYTTALLRRSPQHPPDNTP